jgi:hypothetical protein
MSTNEKSNLCESLDFPSILGERKKLLNILYSELKNNPEMIIPYIEKMKMRYESLIMENEYSEFYENMYNLYNEMSQKLYKYYKEKIESCE